jgi:hypothetical protein
MEVEASSKAVEFSAMSARESENQDRRWDVKHERSEEQRYDEEQRTDVKGRVKGVASRQVEWSKGRSERRIVVERGSGSVLGYAKLTSRPLPAICPSRWIVILPGIVWCRPTMSGHTVQQ